MPLESSTGVIVPFTATLSVMGRQERSKTWEAAHTPIDQPTTRMSSYPSGNEKRSRVNGNRSRQASPCPRGDSAKKAVRPFPIRQKRVLMKANGVVL